MSLNKKYGITDTKIESIILKHVKIKLIEREEFDIKTSRQTIVKDILEGALQSAKKVEDKYGKENLVFTDFEWGA